MNKAKLIEIIDRNIRETEEKAENGGDNGVFEDDIYNEYYYEGFANAMNYIKMVVQNMDD